MHPTYVTSVIYDPASNVKDVDAEFVTETLQERLYSEDLICTTWNQLARDGSDISEVNCANGGGSGSSGGMAATTTFVDNTASGHVTRTGYLKCEAREEVGYVPSSYLEFLDGSAEAENGNGNVANEETQRVNEKHKKKHKKEKRKKEKREANEGSDAEDAPVITRSPRKETGTVEEEGNESPRRRKKKYRKHSQERKWSQRDVEESSTSARSRAAVEDSDRTRSKSKHAKKSVIEMEIAAIRVKVTEENVLVAIDVGANVDVAPVIAIPNQHLRTIRMEVTDEDDVGVAIDTDVVRAKTMRTTTDS
eukprot:jgi/Phyca11/19639/fgenesh1_pg.PHYCAscaffold_50_\